MPIFELREDNSPVRAFDAEPPVFLHLRENLGLEFRESLPVLHGVLIDASGFRLGTLLDFR